MNLNQELKNFYDRENIEFLSKFYHYRTEADNCANSNLNIPLSMFGFLNISAINIIKLSLSLIAYSAIFSPLILLSTGGQIQPRPSEFLEYDYYVTGEFVSNIKEQQDIEFQENLPLQPPTAVTIR